MQERELVRYRSLEYKGRIRTIIAPSLFAANAGKLVQEVKDVEKAGAKYLHIDIMDGHFVPNLSFGPNVVADIRLESKMVFDVHLMVQQPLYLCESFIKAGADIITVHAEIDQNIKEIYDICAAKNVKFGLSICPQTPVKNIIDYIHFLDLLLVMGINPGFGGQQFMPETIHRIQEASTLREDNDAHYLISVDGGVNQKTACAIARAGADILVAGTAVFGKEDRKTAIENILNKTNSRGVEDKI